jgi:hypothetical protein
LNGTAPANNQQNNQPNNGNNNGNNGNNGNNNGGGRKKRYADVPHLKSLNWAEWEQAKTQRTNDALRWTYPSSRPSTHATCKRYCQEINKRYRQPTFNCNLNTNQQQPQRTTVRQKPVSYRPPTPGPLHQSPNPTLQQYLSQAQRTYYQPRHGRSIDYMPRPKRPIPHVPLYYPPRNGVVLHTTRITRSIVVPQIVHKRFDPPNLAISHYPFRALENKGRVKRKHYRAIDRLQGIKKPTPNVRNVDEKKNNYWLVHFLKNNN